MKGPRFLVHVASAAAPSAPCVHDARLLLLAATLIVGALCALPTHPAQAQSTTEVWSTTLTVDVFMHASGEFAGCDDSFTKPKNCSTALGDNDFTYQGTTYQVVSLYNFSNATYTAKFDKDLEDDLRKSGTIYIGSHSYPLSSSTGLSLSVFGSPDWKDRQQVSVRITVPVPATTTTPAADPPPKTPVNPNAPPGQTVPSGLQIIPRRKLPRQGDSSKLEESAFRFTPGQLETRGI